MRPRKEPGREAVQLTIPRHAWDLIDHHVSRALAAARFDGPPPTARDLAGARSAYVAELVERALGWDARYAITVEIHAPAVGNAEAFREVAEWIDVTERTLTEEAPAPVRAAIEANRAMRKARTLAGQ